MADAPTPPRRSKRLSDASARVSFSREVVVAEEHESDSESDSDSDSESESESPPAKKHQRRRVVHWTREEEQCLLRGVKKHGLGFWRQILEEGRDVFHRHRTNVDLKDKWKNLVRKIPQTVDEERAADTRVWRQTVATRTVEELLSSLIQGGSDAASEDEDEEGEPFESARRRSSESRRLSTGEAADPHRVRLYIATDSTAPYMRSMTISTVDFPTVTALKRHLSRQLLEDSPLPTNLLLVGIRSRRLLGDLESVEDCIKRDGRDLYLLHDP